MNFSRFCYITFLALTIGLTFSGAAQAQDERILDYHSDIRIEADASVEVTETIQVRSQQRNIRRGIYRDFPTRYRDRAGNRVVVDFEVIEVLRDGEPEPWFTENVSNGVRVNTGDDSFLPGAGVYTFTIRYRTSRQLGFFDEHDELYWNVTGNGWDFAIDSASAEVRLPEPVDPGAMRLDYYTGPQGASGQEARAEVTEPGVARFETTRPLARREGLTIALGFPKGLVEAPTTMQRAGWLLYDNRGLLIMLLGIIGILIFYIRSWLSKGRGPAAGVIIAQYEPPPGYSPAGLRYVRRKRYDHRCFAADLVEMGVKGLVRINQDKKGRREEWEIVKDAETIGPDEPPSQQALFPKLFEGSSRLELKNTNAARVSAAQLAHTSALKKRYNEHYINMNYPTIIIGWAASLAVGVFAFRIAGGDGMMALIIAATVLGLINIIFTNLMPAPTETGRKLLDHIEGLRLYLSVADREELKNLQHTGEDEPSLTPARFESLLPYALALDVEEAWTDKFTQAVGNAVAEQTSRSMRWYGGSGAALGSMGAMSKSLGSSLSGTISSSATPPGSSSGGGGGGSSGGGGGGGGGGGR